MGDEKRRDEEPPTIGAAALPETSRCIAKRTQAVIVVCPARAAPLGATAILVFAALADVAL